VNVQDLKQAGLRFSYTGSTTVPEIPYIQDVLVTLRLANRDQHLEFDLSKHPPYTVNVLLVALAVAETIHTARERGWHKETIAQAIVDLCPDQAKCLFNPAYAEAWATLGHDVKRTSREQLWLQCGCPRCRAALAHEGRSLACDY
jgi:hypothetical protein